MVDRVAHVGLSDRQIRPALRPGVRTKRRGDTKPSRVIFRQEKPLGSNHQPVPQTDTGRKVEDTKAREITLIKELGKLPS